MFFGFGQIAEGDIHAEIARRGITIEEPVIDEPPIIYPPDDEFPITPIVVTPPPVTIPWIPTVTEPPEDDFIDELEPKDEEKKAFVLSTGTMIAFGVGAVVIIALLGAKQPRRALPPARRERVALPAAPEQRASRGGKQIMINV